MENKHQKQALSPIKLPKHNT